jgi:hypothetical protein
MKEESELIKRTGKSRNSRKVMEGYFKPSDSYHEIIVTLEGVKDQLALQKEKMVNAIDMVKDLVNIETTLKVLNISRVTYHN